MKFYSEKDLVQLVARMQAVRDVMHATEGYPDEGDESDFLKGYATATKLLVSKIEKLEPVDLVSNK